MSAREPGPSAIGHHRRLACATAVLAAAAHSAQPQEPAPAKGEGERRGPDVTVIRGAEHSYREFRWHGRLQLVRVVPDTGRTFYLIPAEETEPDEPREDGDDGVEFLRAQWQQHEF